jgi:hypothetical protein
MAARLVKDTAAAVIVTAALTMGILTPVVVYRTRTVLMALDYGGSMVEGMMGAVVKNHNHSKIYLNLW